MSIMSEKSAHRNLFACATKGCPVITFVGNATGSCPSCELPGYLLRTPPEERLGMPVVNLEGSEES